MTRRKCKALRVRQAAVLFFKCDRQVYVLTITEMQGKKLDAVLASLEIFLFGFETVKRN